MDQNIADSIRSAIAEDRFDLVYQPKVSASTGRVVGVEALARLHCPLRGDISPGDFIPIAECEGLVARVSDQVARIAFRQMAEWSRIGVKASMAINLSPSTMSDTSLPERLVRCCLAAGARPGNVTIELTESAAFDMAAVIESTNRLREMGFEISLDDFGTGFSSLLHLRELPCSELKVDRRFVSEMTTSTQSRAIVESAVALAQTLGMRAVAEGVEDRSTAAMLNAVGCDVMQGFYLSRPLQGAAVPAWIAKQNSRVPDWIVQREKLNYRKSIVPSRARSTALGQSASAVRNFGRISRDRIFGKTWTLELTA